MISQELKQIISGTIEIVGEKPVVSDPIKLQTKVMDQLAGKAVFGEAEEKKWARWLIWELGQRMGARPASINDLYLARGRGEVDKEFAVPAINLRGMAYEMARAIFKKAKEQKVGAFMVEIARSEMEYTSQSSREFASVVLAAALREGFRGPIFIQGDHFQPQTGEVPGEPKAGEAEKLRRLVKEAIEAGFYNIDVDASTLVDLSQEKETDQQRSNVKYTLELLTEMRALQPEGVEISIGGEIGHIGGKNSTLADFKAFIEGFNRGKPENLVGLSKIAVQTGTSHGGVVLADGSIAKAKVDFQVLKEISQAGRQYGLAGAVQHGASTLPDELMSRFAETAAEVHLATGMQNLILDHPRFPKALLSEMYAFLDKEKGEERADGWTVEQFHYKLRKKAWGKFKKECWFMEEKRRDSIRESLEERCGFIFKALEVEETAELVGKTINKLPAIHKQPEMFE